MKPQPQNGLKRPHPGANNSELNPNSDPKRINLEQSGPPGPGLNNIQSSQQNQSQQQNSQVQTVVKPEVKSEPITNQQQSQQPQNLRSQQDSLLLETKVKCEVKPDLSESNEASLDDFDMDLENADFQDLIKDISDLNPDMLDFVGLNDTKNNLRHHLSPALKC